MKTCLVVDDSKVIRKVARHILESLDLSVSEAVDGQDALTQCEAAAPDVVLLDWNMPNMNGLELLQEIRKVNKDVPVIMVTTEGSKDKVTDAIQYGVSDYLVKPFTPDSLREKLGKWVGADI